MKMLQRPTIVVTIACILMAAYLGFLMISNFRTQTALRESTLKRFRLDLEKRAASLGYFISERKYDLDAMASSREVAAFFINRSLGMSEAYGLKVNLFVIANLLKNTIQEKTVQGDSIYDRFLLVDRDGIPVVDTATQQKSRRYIAWKKHLMPGIKAPVVFIDAEGGHDRVAIAAACIVKGELVGELIAWLNLDTLLAHFVDVPANTTASGFGLFGNDGKSIRTDSAETCLDLRERVAMSIHHLSDDGFSSMALSGALSGALPGTEHGGKTVMVSRAPIHNAPLQLLAWVENDAVLGALTPWELLLGTGSLALIILGGIVKMVKSNTEKLILKARFEASRHQQALLTAKNNQLKKEIALRQDAEKALEAQRTVRMRSDRLRSLGEMAAGIAHELNQPLVGVRGMAELILLTADQENRIPKERVENSVRVILEQTDRMVHIIDHVRMFAREAGKMETSLVDLNDVVRSGLNLISAQFKSRDLFLESDLAAQELPVEINPFSVEEVILNLLINAKDAVESRKQAAAAKGSEYTPRIAIRTRNGGPECRSDVWLEVTDNGIGIADGDAPKVFDPFFTTKPPDKGTGLGLSICKSIVEEFDGTIDFATRPGEGTVFTVHFPKSCTAKENKNETNAFS